MRKYTLVILLALVLLLAVVVGRLDKSEAHNQYNCKPIVANTNIGCLTNKEN